MTIEQIWNAINDGLEVNWGHGGYYVHAIDYDRGLNESSSLSLRDGKALRVTCKSNYFGSLISECDLSKCYINKGE